MKYLAALNMKYLPEDKYEISGLAGYEIKINP